MRLEAGFFVEEIRVWIPGNSVRFEALQKESSLGFFYFLLSFNNGPKLINHNPFTRALIKLDMVTTFVF
jgi:hypothetical protein